MITLLHNKHQAQTLLFKKSFISSALHTLLLELWAISISKHRCTFLHFLHCSRFLFTAGRLPICIAAAAVAISIEHNSEMYFNDIQICMYQTFTFTIIDVRRHRLGNIKTHTFSTQSIF